MKHKISENTRVLIEDLIVAVRNACWQDGVGKPNLNGPTYHMTQAVRNLEEVIYPIVCPTCNQRTRD